MTDIVKDDSVNAEIVDPVAALKDELRRWHEQAEAGAQTYVEGAWHAGRVLLQIKEIDGHGNYTQWVKDNFKGSPRTAQVYTRMARKAQSPADLGNSIDATDKALRSAAKPADTPRLLGTMQAWDLFRILSVKVFAANHDAMPNLMTVNLEATGDQLIAVATDRFVVGVARAEYQGDPFNVNIHTGYVDQVLRMNVSRFSRQCDVTIRITDDAELEFTTDEQKVIIPVTGYDFPPWRKLIPDTIDSDDSEPCHALSVSLLAKFAAIDSAQK